MKTILLFAIAFTTAGCAGPETGTDTGRWVEPEYTTGSNIPRKSRARPDDDIRVIDKEALQRQQPVPAPIPMGGGRSP
jgi:hypothetical protein